MGRSAIASDESMAITGALPDIRLLVANGADDTRVL
jgi:hypothetical protein